MAGRGHGAHVSKRQSLLGHAAGQRLRKALGTALLSLCALSMLTSAFGGLSAAAGAFVQTRATSNGRRLQAGRSAEAESADSKPEQLGVVAVTGATGRTGQLVVDELLRSGRAAKVIALVRNSSKATEVFSTKDERLQTVMWDNESTAGDAIGEADAMIWCSEGETGLLEMTSHFAKLGARENGEPRFVMCSTASLTRPTWPKDKKARFSGAADIPIVRLNPQDILGAKRKTEEKVRSSGASYTIVRPTGLNDKWPPGRPVLSQGDFAVGRTSRADLASLLSSMLFEPKATGKTFEAVSVAGYPKPARGYGEVLSKLRPDTRPGLPRLLDKVASYLLPGKRAAASGADAATYGLLQQLLPGEEQDSAALAMGQSYEQYDRGEQGRLGRRGEERVPESVGR